MAHQSQDENQREFQDRRPQPASGKRTAEPIEKHPKRQCRHCTVEDDNEVRCMMEKKIKEHDEVSEESAYNRGLKEFKTHANWVAQVLRIIQAAGDPIQAQKLVQRFMTRTLGVRTPGAGGFAECGVEEQQRLIRTRFVEESFHTLGEITEATEISRKLMVPYIKWTKAADQTEPEPKPVEQTIEKWKSAHDCVFCSCDPQITMQIEDMKAKKAREHEMVRKLTFQPAATADASVDEGLRRTVIVRAKAEVQESASFVVQILRIIQYAPHQLEARARVSCFIRRARVALRPAVWFEQCSADDRKALLHDIPEKSFYTFDDIPEAPLLNRRRVIPYYIDRLKSENRIATNQNTPEE